MKAKETKFDQFGALKPSDLFFSKLASDIYSSKRYQAQFKTYIIVSVLLYILAVAISTVSSYFIVYDFLVGMIKYVFLAVFFTVTALLLLEFLVYLSLENFFKFLLKGDIKKWVPFAIVSLALFSVVFVLTTNGIAMHMSEKISKTVEITEFHEIESNTLKNDYSQQIKRLEEQIFVIKNNPLGWSNGKRSNLTKEQLISIEAYLTEIKQIKQELKTELKGINEKEKTELNKNRNETTSESNKYYWVFAIIVFLEVLISGFLMFSWSKIHAESNTDQNITDKVQDVSQAVGKNIFSAIEEQIYHVQNMFALGLQKNSYNFTPFEVVDKNKEKEPEKIDFSEQKKPVVVGGFFANKKQENPVFKTDLKTNLKTDLKTQQTSSYLDKSSKISTSNLMYLQKHKAIVKTLKKYEPEILNNSLINSVLSEVKKQKYKSRSTIQKVHEIIKVYGYDKINKEGGIEL